MKPLSTVPQYADDSLPFGLLITLVPLAERDARRIHIITGEQVSETEVQSGSLRRLGQVVVTPAARASLRDSDWICALAYHLRGESEAARADDSTLHFRDALKGRPVLAAYRSSLARTFWIVTQANRSRTTVLMPNEIQSSGDREESRG